MSDTTDDIAAALATLLRAAGSGPSTAEPTRKQLYRVEEAAELLQVSRAHLYSLIRSGDVRSVKLGRSRRITQGEIERLMTGAA